MKNFILICLLAVSVNSFAQLAKADLPKPGVISGKVIDKETKEPLAYVNVVVKDMANKIITGGITDEQGKVLRQWHFMPRNRKK